MPWKKNTTHKYRSHWIVQRHNSTQAFLEIPTKIKKDHKIELELGGDEITLTCSTLEHEKT